MRLIFHLASLFLRGTALMLCLAAAVAGLACLAGAFSDRLDILTHGAVLWMTCGILGLALAVAVSHDDERRALVAAATIGIGSMALLMAPEVLATLHQSQKPPAGAATLKLIQFNLWAENHDTEETTAWILKQNADVVITEESGGAALSIVRVLERNYPYSNVCRSKYGCDTRIFSRWPIIQESGFSYARDGLAGAWATLRHPRGDFTVVGNHFIWPIPAGRWQVQSRVLAARIADLPKNSLIVTGDFNSTPWSWGLRRQDKALGLERRTHALTTWPSGAFSRVATAPFPVLAIDHVYAGKAWKTVEVERGPVLGSDHRPVVAILAR